MLSHGRWILSNGLYPAEEMLTMHQGLHFTFQKWLSCIILYKVYLIKGELALRAFMGICTIIFVLLLKKLLKLMKAKFGKEMSGDNDAGIDLIIVSSSIIIAKGTVPSPRIFSLIFLVLELICLENYKKSKNNIRYLIPIPILTCLCMNFHID